VGQHKDAFVGLDVAKLRHAVAVADDGRNGEIRYLGEIDAAAESVRRLALERFRPDWNRNRLAKRVASVILGFR
jgi:hypothetical protein